MSEKSPLGLHEGRAHCPVTETGRKNRRGANRRQSLCMDSSSEDAGPASLRQKSTRPTDGDAVSLCLFEVEATFELEHITLLFPQFIQKFKKWTFPQKTNDPPPLPNTQSPLLTHAHHRLLQNTWGSTPQLFGNTKKLQLHKRISFTSFSLTDHE